MHTPQTASKSLRPSPESNVRILDPDSRSPAVDAFEEGLNKRVIGQPRAIRTLTKIYQSWLAGVSEPDRPVCNLLLLGPTGSGKTVLVESVAEVLFSTRKSMIKIDCAEFSHSHEVAKLIGSPPGYLGHRETRARLAQQDLDSCQTAQVKITLVLFDEIEKAHPDFWSFLLGILDKGVATLGNNERVDFSKCMIFMTSNLGAREMDKLVTGQIGFKSSESGAAEAEELDQKIYKVAKAAALKQFSPEFINRIDKMIVFRSLQQEHLEVILDIELNHVQSRLTDHLPFVFELMPAAKKFLLEKGCDQKSGARRLKREIQRRLVNPLAGLMTSGQIEAGDLVMVDKKPDSDKLEFACYEDGAIVAGVG